MSDLWKSKSLVIMRKMRSSLSLTLINPGVHYARIPIRNYESWSSITEFTFLKQWALRAQDGKSYMDNASWLYGLQVVLNRDSNLVFTSNSVPRGCFICGVRALLIYHRHKGITSCGRSGANCTKLVILCKEYFFSCIIFPAM